MRRTRPPAPLDPELRAAREWLGLAIAVLVAAGLFAFAVVIARMPPFDRWVTDPLFFKRCLAAHVNFALFAWFYSFVAALLFLVRGPRPAGRLALRSPQIAAGGVVLMGVGAALPDGQPLLANYIPTIEHPLFQLGQLVFGAGVLASVLDPRLLPGAPGVAPSVRLPGAARVGLRAAAAALLLAALVLGVSALRQTSGLAPAARYELLFWGVGHVLQLASAIAMVSVWIALLAPALGRSPVDGRTASWLFAALLLPWTIAPFLALRGTWSPAYREGFTDLMRWGILPVVTIFLGLCAGALVRARRAGGADAPRLADPRVAAFLASAGLTLLGFVLGALIRGSTTMVPAHYHASVGGVTVAFMAVTFPLLDAFRVRLRGGRLARAVLWQPILYGAGMALFAAGFALAGAHGMGRKMYGAEQAARSVAESVGLAVMGVGGFVAIAGGLLFLGALAASLWGRAPTRSRVASELVPSSWRWSHGARHR